MILIAIGLVLSLILWIVYKRYSLQKTKFLTDQSAFRTFGEKKKSIAFLHPFCNCGGGGEKVLFKMIQKLQDQNYRLCVYSGENVADEEIRNKADVRFNVKIGDGIQFIQVLETYLLKPVRRFTMLIQIFGQIIYGYKCINRFQPDVIIDSTGLPFTYYMFKILMPKIEIIAYVHYPFISTDMIEQISEDRYNNKNVAQSSSKQGMKRMYYKILFFLFQQTGKLVTKTFANSTWTYNHMKRTWPGQISKLYPPCTVEPFMRRKHFSSKFNIVSLAQFRPEKNHNLQIEIVQLLVERLPNEISQHLHLDIMGSVRGKDDEELFEKLEQEIIKKDLSNHITLHKNLQFDKIVQKLTQAMIGLHTMEYEHFGISLVEMLAAGLIVIAHNSAGPKLDILKDNIGILCESIEDYVMGIVQVMQMTDSDRTQYILDGRKRAHQFSDESFMEQFSIE